MNVKALALAVLALPAAHAADSHNRGNDYECYGNMFVARIAYKVTIASDMSGYDIEAQHRFKRCGVGGQVTYSFWMGEDSKIESSSLPFTEELQHDADRRRFHIDADGSDYLSRWDFTGHDDKLTLEDFDGHKVLAYPSFDSNELHKEIHAEITVNSAVFTPQVYHHKERRFLSSAEKAAYVTATFSKVVFHKPLGEMLVLVFEKR